MKRQVLAQKIYDVSHLTGQFTLRSGQISSEYFDKYRFESKPDLLRQIAQQMKYLIPEDTEVLAGLEMGGIPLATALAFETNLPICFVRKEPKSYGTCKFAEGVDVVGKRLCIIEDVVTTGGQALISAKDLRDSGAIVENVVCVIFRGETDENFKQNDLKLRHLFTMAELKQSQN